MCECETPKSVVQHGGMCLRVDAGVAPLVQQLLAHDIHVIDACADFEGWILLELPVSDAEILVSVVAAGEGAAAERARETWSWDFDAEDDREGCGWCIEVFTEMTDEGELYLKSHIKFPASDLWPVMGALIYSV